MSEVKKYSLRAMQEFVELAEKRRKRTLRQAAIAMRQAQGGDGKAFEEYLKGLEEDNAV